MSVTTAEMSLLGDQLIVDTSNLGARPATLTRLISYICEDLSIDRQLELDFISCVKFAYEEQIMYDSVYSKSAYYVIWLTQLYILVTAITPTPFIYIDTCIWKTIA